MAAAATPATRLDRVLALVRDRVPGLRLVHKPDVWWMRGLGVLVHPVNPEFMAAYTTVIGRTVYLPEPPERFPPDALATTLLHELVHQLDQARWGALFYASYGAGVGRSGRAYWERRAYAVDLLVARERGGPAAVVSTAERLAALFSGSGYGWMWAGRGAARAFLAPTVAAVLDGSIDREAPYDAILAAWRGPEAR